MRVPFCFTEKRTIFTFDTISSIISKDEQKGVKKNDFI